MFTLIKGGSLYGPEKMGVKDILIVGRTIARISDRIDLPDDFRGRIISASGKIVTPGLIDLHVHLLGGGGEGGPRTRTPEITLSKITRAGVTTVVGCLGTDDLSRRPETLLAKAMQLEEEGDLDLHLQRVLSVPPLHYHREREKRHRFHPEGDRRGRDRCFRSPLLPAHL